METEPVMTDKFNPHWPDGLEANTLYERREDMSPDGYIRVIACSDGDVVLAVIGSEESGSGFASVEFCTPFMGGGHSPRVRQALLNLAEAIMLDNRDSPRSF